MNPALLLVFIVLSLAACSKSPDLVQKFGMEYNSERSRFGLRPISADSVLMIKHEYIFPVWVNPIRQKIGNPRVPHWVSKQLEIRDLMIASETETYSSGHEYSVGEKGMREEQLIIRYDYNMAKAGKSPWLCKVFWGPLQGDYSLEQANEILIKWGLSRLK